MPGADATQVAGGRSGCLEWDNSKQRDATIDTVAGAPISECLRVLSSGRLRAVRIVTRTEQRSPTVGLGADERRERL